MTVIIKIEPCHAASLSSLHSVLMQWDLPDSLHASRDEMTAADSWCLVGKHHVPLSSVCFHSAASLKHKSGFSFPGTKHLRTPVHRRRLCCFLCLLPFCGILCLTLNGWACWIWTDWTFSVEHFTSSFMVLYFIPSRWLAASPLAGGSMHYILCMKRG